MFDSLLEVYVFAVVCFLLIWCNMALINTKAKLKDTEIRLKWAIETLDKIKKGDSQ